ncbi:MAG: ATP phosphoribosyltransferase regulatory subunit, partial [Methylococcaceae bacterium]|nr:ATP phosphoribosyltransferase regulatory subunit [Methylococcaceae bacterium]
MLPKDPWLLPDGIDEILPEEARQLEDLRRRLLDLFISWGYQQVFTPFIDYLSSL